MAIWIVGCAMAQSRRIGCRRGEAARFATGRTRWAGSMDF